MYVPESKAETQISILGILQFHTGANTQLHLVRMAEKETEQYRQCTL